MPSASTSSVNAAADRALSRAQAVAAIAQRLQLLGHPADLLDRHAVACLVGSARGSERQLRADLAAVLFVASTEDAPKVDAALVRRALQTGLRDADQAPAPSRWALVWRRALAGVLPARRVAVRSDVWRDDFRLSLAAACIAALASIVFVIYARTSHGGVTTRPVWADRFAPSAAQLRLAPADPRQAPASGMAASGSGAATQGEQRLAAATPGEDQVNKEPAAPASRQPGDRAPQLPGGQGQPRPAGRAAAPQTGAQKTTSPDEADAVPPTQAEIAGLRQLQANASADPDRPAGPGRQPGVPAGTMPAPQTTTGTPDVVPPAQPSRLAAAPAAPLPAGPALAAPATSAPAAILPVPTASAPNAPALAAQSQAAQSSAALARTAQSPAAQATTASAPAAPAPAGQIAPPADNAKLAALQAFPPPISVRSLPVPPSASEPREHAAAPGRLKTAAAAAVLLLYPDRDAQALARLRPLAIKLQQQGITNIRARPTRALPARRAISYFYTDDEPLAHVIAQTLSEADWPQLKGNSLQPSLVLVPPGLHPRRPGTIEIQLP